MKLPDISTDTLEKIGNVFLAAAALILAPIMIGGAVWGIWFVWTGAGTLAGLLALGGLLGFIGFMLSVAALTASGIPGAVGSKLEQARAASAKSSRPRRMVQMEEGMMGSTGYKLRSGPRLAGSYMWGKDVFELWRAEMQYESDREAWRRRAMQRAVPCPYPLSPLTSNRWPWGSI